MRRTFDIPEPDLKRIGASSALREIKGLQSFDTLFFVVFYNGRGAVLVVEDSPADGGLNKYEAFEEDLRQVLTGK